MEKSRQSVSKTIDEITSKSSKILGISKEELIKRKVKATQPHAFVNNDTEHKFKVQSATRAMQIMTQGTREAEFAKRQESITLRSRAVIGIRWGLIMFSCALAYWVGKEFFLPTYHTVQERNRRWQIRYERAQAARRNMQKDDNIQALLVGSEL